MDRPIYNYAKIAEYWIDRIRREFGGVATATATANNGNNDSVITTNAVATTTTATHTPTYNEKKNVDTVMDFLNALSITTTGKAKIAKYAHFSYEILKILHELYSNNNNNNNSNGNSNNDNNSNSKKEEKEKVPTTPTPTPTTAVLPISVPSVEIATNPVTVPVVEVLGSSNSSSSSSNSSNNVLHYIVPATADLNLELTDKNCIIATGESTIHIAEDISNALIVIEVKNKTITRIIVNKQ
ncbi:MAG: hypothetical protein QXN32_01145 [Candidatus Nitrosocaldus sp.]